MRGILATTITFLIFLSVSVMLWWRYAKRMTEVPAYLDSYWDDLKEKRRTIRLQERLPVTCTIEGKPKYVHHIFSKNISGEGICLQVPEILAEGAALDLKIKIPDTTPVDIRGEVVWVKETQRPNSESMRLFDTGIRFTRVEPDDKARLSSFINAVLKNKGIEGGGI